MEEDKPQEIPDNKQSRNEKIEAFLKEQYAFRYNTIKSKPEFRSASESVPFIPVTKYDLNTMKRKIDLVIGVNTSTENIRAIIESDFSPKVNPVQEYFRQLARLPPVSGRMTALADTVTVANPDKWPEYLTKWLVAVVANAMNETGCQNHTCLVLTGEQGRFKTT